MKSLRSKDTRAVIEDHQHQGRAFVLRPPPPVWLHSPVHLERVQVLTQKIELEIMDCIMISSSLIYREVNKH
jgi:hypothetical protein